MRRLLIISNIIFVLTLLPQFQAVSQITAPIKPNSVRMAVIGDMGTGETPQYDVARQMLGAHSIFPFAFVIMLGDNIYGGRTPNDFERKFSIPYKPLLDAGVKFYASLGNHDNANESFYAPYNMNGSTFYTFKKSNVRFFALNSNYMDTKQLAWLENGLKDAGDGDWKVCYFHHPLYSSGKTHGSSIDLRHVLEPLFIKYHVDIVFSGHDHVYERVKPQNGIYYFTEGASGQLRVGDLNQTTMTAKGFDTDNTFMLVEFAGNRMNFQTISRAGKTVDSGVIERQGHTDATSSMSVLEIGCCQPSKGGAIVKKRADVFWATLGEGGLVLVVAAVAWATKQPLIFASLGPTAYELVEQPQLRSARMYNIIVGHLVGLGAGFAAVYLSNAWASPNVLSSGLVSGERLWAATMAAALTTAVTLVLKAGQPAALATTLLVSLGSMQTRRGAIAIVAGVLIITTIGEPLRRFRLKHTDIRPAK